MLDIDVDNFDVKSMLLFLRKRTILANSDISIKEQKIQSLTTSLESILTKYVIELSIEYR